MKMLKLALFNPSEIDRFSAVFPELYSKLWDFAEHSISHREFNLPSALGETPVHRVNQLLRELYGGQFASLSFGGSSGALLTLLTAVLPKLHAKRDLILFDDVCHQSTIGGLIFGRWKAVRLTRQRHPQHQTSFPLSCQAVQDTIERYGAERFAAIVLVLPSYDGFRSPSEETKIFAYAKSHGITVVVDGAWDGLRFRRDTVRTPPLSSICDVWISSPHKRGLTPSSLGCMITDHPDIARLWDEALDLGFRSSSISFVEVMVAEHRLSQVLNGDWDEALEKAGRAAQSLRKRIDEVHPGLYVIGPDQVQAETYDPAHILIGTDKVPDLEARDWARVLSSQFALDVEKSTSSTLLLLCGSPIHLDHLDEVISILKSSLNLTLKRNQSPSYDK